MDLSTILTGFLVSDAPDAAEQNRLLGRLAAWNCLDAETGLLNRAAYDRMCAALDGGGRRDLGMGLLRWKGERGDWSVVRDCFDFEVIYCLGGSLAVLWPDVELRIFDAVSRMLSQRLSRAWGERARFHYVWGRTGREVSRWMREGGMLPAPADPFLGWNRRPAAKG